MLRRLLKDSAAYTLGRALTAVVALAMLPVYTRFLAPAEYGLYDLGTVILGISGMLVGLEVAQAAARFYCDEAELQARREYFSTALAFTLAAFALFALLAAAAAPYAARPLFGSDADRATVVLVALATAATVFFRLASAQLRWLLRPWPFLWTSVLQVVVSAAVSVWLLARGSGPHALFWGVIAGNAAGFLAALWLGREGIGFTFASDKLRRMLAFSLPLVASSAAVWVTQYADRLAIKGLLTMSDLGLYGAGYRFASAIDMVMVAFDAAFMPLVYSMYREPETPRTLAKLMRLMVLLGVTLVVLLAAFSRELLLVLTSREYLPAATLVPVLAGGVLLMRLNTLAPGLWLANRTSLLAWNNVFVAGANLGLNLLLIPVLGIIGSALATVGAGALGFAINLRASQAHYPVPHDWPRLIGGMLLGAAGIAALMQLSAVVVPLSLSGVLIKGLAAAAVAGAALLWLFSGFERAQLVREIRRQLEALKA